MVKIGNLFNNYSKIIFSIMFGLLIILTLSIFVYADVMCDDDFECGLSAFIGVEYCIGDDVNKDRITPECINPGFENSMCVNHTTSELLFTCNDIIGDLSEPYCKNDDMYESKLITPGECVTFNNGISGCSFSNEIFEEILIKDCEDSYCEEFENICDGKDVYKKRECYSKGCSEDECFNNKNVEKEIVEECIYGCINGECVPEPVECNEDIDCGNDEFIGNRFCKDESIYQDFIEYKCLNPGLDNSTCVFLINETLIDECDYKCGDGRCKRKVIDPYGGFSEINETLADKYFKSGINTDYFGMELNESIVEIVPSSVGVKNVETSRYTMSTWVIIMIILVVVLIVLIIVMMLVR
ncbi:hypothetical protein GOV12_06100 [Candidatus Pacearchaeota archaeon]|nr:hypothetical protein [Candidatus Pacearchaeota archaeon]